MKRTGLLGAVAMSAACFAATIGSPIFAQEHTPDQHTLLLLHCNGDVNGAQGETPTQVLGVTFEPGIFGEGAYFSPGNQVYFPSAGNLSSTEGTLEFWIKPRWNGNDGGGYVMLRFGLDGGMYFGKDGANNWKITLNRFGVGNPEVGVAFNVSAWQANQWHHAAFTWRSEALRLYVDGQLLNELQGPVPLNVVNESTFQLGADFSSFHVDAVIDELRISDIERSAQEIQASFLAGQSNPFTVTNTNDSGPGSLRQAILNANATPGLDVIRFDIPGDGTHTIQPLSPLPAITDPVVIDGTTQPGFAGQPIIEMDGTNAGAGTDGLQITAGSSTVQGLVINRFDRGGIFLATNGGNVIKGNYIGTDVSGSVALSNSVGGVLIYSPNNLIGGTTRSARNVIAGNPLGICLCEGGAASNLVQGNFIGTDVTGTKDLGNPFFGVTIGGAGNTIGGTVPGAGNLISGDNRIGIWMIGIGTTGNRVQGNLIGVDITGTTALGNSAYGVLIQDAPRNIIGGTTAGARNVVSGNGAGVVVFGPDSPGNLVQGNFIGTDVHGAIALGNTWDGVGIANASNNNTIQGNVISSNGGYGLALFGGTGNQVMNNMIGTTANGIGPLGNVRDGVFITDGASNNTIGGASIFNANRIAFNGRDGVRAVSGAGNAILFNSIQSNSGLGIDLNNDGLTPNDDDDSDTGANNLQNFPILTVVNRGDGKKALRVALNSAPNTQFTLQFFANRSCDPSNHGEGELFVISRKVTTDGSGDAAFQVAIPNFVPEGFLLTATATDPSGNTSEFSPCVEIAGASGTVVNPEDNLEKGDAGEAGSSVPDHYALLQNHPNPFNPETEIRFALPEASNVVVKVFNTLGEEVVTLVDEQREAGYHAARWDGRDKLGNVVASGVYLYQLQAGSFSQVRKMSFIR